MPPSGEPIDDFPAFNPAFGGPYAFNVDLYPDNADDYLDLIHHPDSDSHVPKGAGTGLFQPATGTTLPTNLSPTASDPADDSSDSSRSPKVAAMDSADRMDMEGAWDDFLNFGSDQNHPDTINPADIDQPMSNGSHHAFMPTLFPDAERASPAFDSSSPSESTTSSSALNDSDESLPMPMDTAAKPNVVSIPPRTGPNSRNKRLSVRAARSRILNLADLDQQQSSSSANRFSNIGSREVSPMSQLTYSQGPSPFNPSNTNFSWFDYPRPKLSPSTNQSPNGAMDDTSIDAPASAFFSRAQANPVASQKPTLTFFDMDPKSRVETQIKLFVALHPVPEGIKKMRLPPHTISKPKFLAKPSPPPQPDTLQLSTQLVCTSAMQKPHLLERALARAAASAHASNGKAEGDDEKPENGGEVRICGGCVLREQKRANRKKNKKPDEDEDWKRYESERVIVFNTHEVKELKPVKPTHPASPGTMEIDLPMRIACYCRHHHEKSGFQVIFTLKDHLGNVLTQALTPSIMITDDHKTPQSNSNHAGGVDNADSSAVPAASNGTNDMNTIQPGHPFRHTQSTSDIQALKRSASALVTPAVHSGNSSMMTTAAPTPRNLSRPPSPGAVGPSAKKRKSSGTKIPTTLHMTPIGANPFAQQAPGNLSNGGPGPSSSSTSPFSPPSSIPYPESNASAFTPPSNSVFTPGPQTPTGNEQMLFHADASRMPNTDARAVQQPLFPTPASAHNSRAPSPSSLMNGALQQQSLNSLGQVSQMLNNGLPVGPGFSRQSMPDILKVLPTEGSTSGGIEISIFGSGFRQGQEVYFGDSRATTTTYWADSALTCLLPPYHQAGPVPVSVRGPNGQMLSLPRPSAQFLYKDESQDQLSALALGVLSHKLSGSTENVREFIMRLLNFSGEDNANGPNNFSGGGPGGYTMNTETQLLKVLDLLDMDDSVNKAKFNLKRKATGHTMLHLSVALGYHRFTAGLLARGANPNVRDVGGYTPLHYAALHDHPELVRRLIQAKADPTLRTRQGLLASDVATTRDVIRAIKRAGRRGSTIHSRANSATSLRSLWEPPRRRASASSQFAYSESSSESDEMIESSSEEELEAEDSYLQMAPRSRRNPDAHSSRVSLVELAPVEEQGGIASAAVAIAAFKEQIQQFQQNMMQNLSQNLSHLQMPNMAALQDYQAYLNSAQQRMSAFIPNIGPLATPSPALPPAYEDIFPGGRRDGKGLSVESHDLDTKTASAARAAADYDADRKCATLYDQAQETEQAESSVVMEQQAEEKRVQRQLPKLLQIGRKNNITKEQQDNLRQARAEQQKGLSRDPKLFLFWVSERIPILKSHSDVSRRRLTSRQIPLFLLICFRGLYLHFPGPFNAAASYAYSMWMPEGAQPAQGVVLGEVN